jgi:hypothetical protein
MMMAATENEGTVLPHLDARFYPNLDSLMKALQDEGTPTGERSTLKYKLIEKLCVHCAKVITQCKSGNFPNMPTTLTHAKKAMHDCILRIRKKSSTSKVLEGLRKYGSSDNMIYILMNEDQNGGWNLVLHALMNYWAQSHLCTHWRL